MDLFSCLSPFVFCSFASGSSGNCYYVGKQDEGLLVDAGVNAKQIVTGLVKNDLSMKNIKAILITHDHIDHVKGLEVLTKNTPVPIYAHSDCLQGLAEGNATKKIDSGLFHEIEPMQPFEICGITIEAFPVMHDGRGAVGYHFNYEGHTLSIATDIGMSAFIGSQHQFFYSSARTTTPPSEPCNACINSSTRSMSVPT